MRKKEKKVMRTRNKILLATALFVVAFVIAMVIIFCIYQSTPDTLIGCVLGGSGLVELVTGGMSLLDIIKEKNDGIQNE